MDRAFRQNTKWMCLLKGLLLSYMITMLILLILSLLMLKMDLSGTVISGGINLCYIISAAAGGFYTGKKMEHRKFIWGLIIGAIYFVLLMLVSMALNHDASLPLGSYLTVCIISSLSGMLGGMVS